MTWAVVDRNVWQFLAEAMHGSYDPTSATREARDERIAALRILLYTPTRLLITPSVHIELERIKRPDVLRENAGARDVFLQEIQARDLNEVEVAARAMTLLVHHNKPADCRAVAEAEAAGAADFITFDGDLRKHLSPHTFLTIWTTSEYWQHLAVPRDADPVWVPAPSNPLAPQSWWRW